MSTSPFSNTPTVTVLDGRGLTVRDIAYHRHPDTPEVTTGRITRHRYDARGFLTQSADPRLHDAGRANFTYLTDLAGSVLRTVSVDAGTTVALNDAAGRPLIAVSNISTAGDGAEDLSQAVTRTWQYEDAALPGRPLSVAARNRNPSDSQSAQISAHINCKFATRGCLLKLFPRLRREPPVSPGESRGLNKERP